VGAVTYADDRRTRFLDVGVGPERLHYAEHTAQLIDGEVKRILSDAHELARATLTAHRAHLEAVTSRLLEREVMEGDELRDILAPRAAAPAPAD
jgi:cell division protease FtsH